MCTSHDPGNGRGWAKSAQNSCRNESESAHRMVRAPLFKLFWVKSTHVAQRGSWAPWCCRWRASRDWMQDRYRRRRWRRRTRRRRMREGEEEEVELLGRYQCARRGYRIFHYGLQPAGNHSLWNLRFDAVFKKKIRFGPWGILRTKLRAWGWCWWWWRRGRRQGGPRAVRADGGWGVCADRLYEACAGFPVKSSVTDRVSTWISCWNSQPWRWSQKYSFTINYRLIKLSKYIFHNFQESW